MKILRSQPNLNPHTSCSVLEVEVLGSEIICSSSDKCNSGDLTLGDVIYLELRDFARYLAFISLVHFSHLLICLIILDPFLLITVLQKMYLTLAVLKVASVGTSSKTLPTTDFFLPGAGIFTSFKSLLCL